MKSANTELAYNHIRTRILSGEFRPGEALLTSSLARKIGISRTPVRDALRQLESEGLVMLRPRIGATVKNVDVREFREALILRRALEGYAAAMAATNRTDVDVQELRAVLATMSEFASTRPSRNEAEHVKREFMREDLRLHIAIMTAARNDVMKKEIFRLHLLHRMIAAPPPTEHGADATMSESHASEDRRKVVKSLENVVEAIARQDPDAAEAAMVSHIREFVETVLEQMKPAEPKRRQLTEDELVYTA